MVIKQMIYYVLKGGWFVKIEKSTVYITAISTREISVLIDVLDEWIDDNKGHNLLDEAVAIRGTLSDNY